MQFEIRKAVPADAKDGLLDSLAALVPSDSASPERARKLLEDISRDPNRIIFVADSDGRIVGTVSVVIEKKIIHDGGMVAHLEDLAVQKGMQDSGVGSALVRRVLEYAMELKCYKTVLDCRDDLVSFYEKLGFARHSNFMRFDHPRTSSWDASRGS